jgi:hypothetical protein
MPRHAKTQHAGHLAPEKATTITRMGNITLVAPDGGLRRREAPVRPARGGMSGEYFLEEWEKIPALPEFYFRPE